MCGMSAGFAALFGTPMAAAVFAMEIISVGVMYYGALVPCVVASYVSVTVAGHFDIAPVRFSLTSVPGFTPVPVFKVLVLACLCAAVSRCGGSILCFLLENTLYGSNFGSWF